MGVSKLQDPDNTGNKHTGLVFNIQKYSVHDGPGIRTLVFLKGCPLRCQWCSNPESQASIQEIAFNDSKCIGVTECGLCLKVCRIGAIQKENGKIKINRDLCTHCGACSHACPSKALHIFGEYISIEEILKKVEEDSVFYSRSGGGLTLSGGEPLLQHEFVYQLIKDAKSRGLDTAIETCGFTQWEHLEKVCQYLNTIFYDIKSIDSDKHLKFTGVKNELILENFKRLATEFSTVNIIVRTPVIPGFNDTEDDIKAIVRIIKDYPRVKYELLPYHRFGESKYTFLGREYPFNSVSKIIESKMEQLRSIAKEVK
jgi:pyruvate formate lyase activating enzyme